MGTWRSRVSHEPSWRRSNDSSVGAMPPETQAPADESPRILIVDDHEDNVELLRMRLDAWGYRTASERDGEAALAAIESDPPELVLLDVMMPKVDGFEVARRVKANRNLPFIPIIMQTALDSTEDKVQGRSEEHTSELQSLAYLVCRLLLEKKKIDRGRRISLNC